MDNHFQKLREKFTSLVTSPFVNFSDIVKMKDIMGTYIIYSCEEKIIYIGSTNRFNIRFGVDLKYETTHTLLKKFLKNQIFEDRKAAVDFLTNTCKFKVGRCETKREAEALEHFAIWALNPQYNK